MKVVFLHGIGDGDPEGGWLEGLNGTLEAIGYPPIHQSDVIAPRYEDFLRMKGLEAEMPALTYKPKDDTQSRREFERRQTEVQRLLQQEGNVATFGFNKMPPAMAAAAQAVGAKYVPVANLHQVKRYVTDKGCRGAILRNILKQLPTSGEILLIGHSLGSVIAIDLLDHLPEDLRVRRFITIGSPANSESLRSHGAQLLKKVPYSRVDDWTNFFSYGDHVPMGRGLAPIFPGAQDFAVNLGLGVHGAKRYLAHTAAAKLVASILYPSKDLVPASSDVTVRLTDEQFATLVRLHFAWAVAKHIKDSERAQRYRDALNVIQDDVAAQLQQTAEAGHPLPAELHSLMAGKLPPLPLRRLEIGEAVTVLTGLTITKFVEPQEIDTGDAPKAAIGDMLEKLGFVRHYSIQVGTALTEVDTLMKRTGGIPWGRIGAGAAGLALAAAGPIGIAVAAPAGAFGAAAIVGGLAGFGPGGMMGGLAMLGGLAAGGAGLAAGAALGDFNGETIMLNVTQLSLRVAADYALKLLDLPVDPDLWRQLVTLECQISAELNRLEPFSDPKAVRLQQLRVAKEAVLKLLGFVVDKSIGGAPAIETGGSG